MVLTGLSPTTIAMGLSEKAANQPIIDLTCFIYKDPKNAVTPHNVHRGLWYLPP